MAKQTINIGAAPNDGTGTPLRTSFDYCNQNFTEIYTALGGGVALPGATTQVIFNDGGTNLAGDAGLVYNKTTDALTIGGAVNAASATITGALTVDTTTLKVDATNHRVGIVQASPAYPLDVTGIIHSTQDVYALGGRIALYRSAGASYFDWSTSQDLVWRQVTSVGGAGASPLMTLNSTGLGVGGTPITKFFVQDATLTGASQIREQVIRAASDNTNNSLNSLVGFTFSAAAAAYSAGSLVRSSGVYGINLDNAAFGRRMGLVFYTSEQDAAALERMRIDNSGNVGIGVAPSAWAAAVKALQIGAVGCVSYDGTNYDIASNRYLASGGTSTYIANGRSAMYRQVSGTHLWFYDTGTQLAGGNCAFTQAMTLDASGNLLVGTVTSPTGTKVGAITKLSGVSVEGTSYTSVSTTPVAIARPIGTGGLFFVAGFNTSGGAQGWWLVATIGGGTPTVIANGNSTGLTVAFTVVSGVINMNTTSGTLSVTSFAITN